jgi:gamma-glutamylputrescine oxidase
MKNYYEATANNHRNHSTLISSVKTDICVVGAGFTGLGCALELRLRGYNVVVLEAQNVGYGASGRSGGQIASGYSSGMIETSDIVGLSDSKKLWAFSERSKQILRNRIETYGISCDLQVGEYYAAPKERHLSWLKEEQAFCETHYNYDGYEWAGKTRMREVLAGDRYLGALYDREGGHLHPLNYTLGLADAFTKLGGRIYENSSVVNYTDEGIIHVNTTNGRVCAKTLVLAGNAYLSGVERFLQRRMIPAKSSQIATEPLGAERAKALMNTSACVADTNFDLDYFKMTSDTRLVYGGQDISFRRSSSNNSPIRKNMLKTFPMLTDVKIEFLWEGLVAANARRLPDVGRIGNNVYYAHGYSGQGVCLSAVVSEILAEAICGELEHFEVFNRIPHITFPANKLVQTPLYYTMMLWQRLKDALP